MGLSLAKDPVETFDARPSKSQRKESTSAALIERRKARKARELERQALRREASLKLHRNQF